MIDETTKIASDHFLRNHGGITASDRPKQFIAFELTKLDAQRSDAIGKVLHTDQTFAHRQSTCLGDATMLVAFQFHRLQRVRHFAFVKQHGEHKLELGLEIDLERTRVGHRNALHTMIRAFHFDHHQSRTQRDKIRECRSFLLQEILLVKRAKFAMHCVAEFTHTQSIDACLPDTFYHVRLNVTQLLLQEVGFHIQIRFDFRVIFFALR
mmetsp:Transcript_48673/g.80737  ORF Transcript_48673/g.80737 Transcript_48673/m.80737 type:complete len:209 (-) Transcript_48673:276-902(-)